MADSDWIASLDEQERAQQQLTEKVKKLAVTGTKDHDAQPPEPEDKEIPASAEISLINKLLHSKGLVTSVHDIEVQRKDPRSPLYSAKTFEELHLKPNLLKGLYGMGFNKPSKIQETALPLLLADPPENVIAQSQSGTGKTAAFVLAMLSRINPSEPFPQVLCLSPTFDLAKQTGGVLEKMAQFSPEIKMGYALREEKVSGKTTDHIIIGTAGTVLDWILKKRAFDPKKIKLFVLDEADVMIAQQGQQDQTVRIQKTLSPSCQMCLFSATYDDEVIKFADQLIKDANKLRLKRADETLDNIKQFYVECADEEGKFKALSDLYGSVSIGQAMVFCNSRRSAGELAGKMCKEGHAVALITGESTIDQRIAVLNRFRDGKEKLLITTNLCARGIDIEQVNMVVNFDVPVDSNRRPDFETYLHRIGRTGRFGRKGLAINLVDGRRSLESIREIEKHFGKRIMKLSTDDAEEVEKAVS